MLQKGQKAPLDISVLDINGKKVSLADYSGKWVVLYFYPKDDTPGCTKEACSIRDWRDEIVKTDAVVIGVSKDNPTAHQKFIAKYGLNFPLWSDTEHELMEAFGVWREKKFMGRAYMGTVRATFIINPEDVIAHTWEAVKPESHGEEIMRVLRSLI